MPDRNNDSWCLFLAHTSDRSLFHPYKEQKEAFKINLAYFIAV
jgi:hypothetical protein